MITNYFTKGGEFEITQNINDNKLSIRQIKTTAMNFNCDYFCPYYNKDDKIDGVVVVAGNSVFKLESSYKLKYISKALNFGELRFYRDDCKSHKDCK